MNARMMTISFSPHNKVADPKTRTVHSAIAVMSCLLVVDPPRVDDVT
jgi:hypothetical protein